MGYHFKVSLLETAHSRLEGHIDNPRDAADLVAHQSSFMQAKCPQPLEYFETIWVKVGCGRGKSISIPVGAILFPFILYRKFLNENHLDSVSLVPLLSFYVVLYCTQVFPCLLTPVFMKSRCF
jgi:hypothetical protein